ncbi:DUF1707 and DUF4190 domain-containing protein [Streptomyces sp. YIM 98790]|uniref:DUF1707 and DUF4190 domain-containing protein n=1 Tax=Streptomyces sp. YIM 98790 TaxID=2689077 RepID=UPI00140991CB|nr:DUF1707 and DUF4190 domain-containing protein [Streptomyces sp. YIM 98790]
MRASDADRERAADVLKAGFAEGRLTKQELDERLTRLQYAMTYAEIQPLIADLPQGPMPMAVAQPAPPPVPMASVPPPRPTNGTATASLICGIFTVFTGGLSAVPAVVLGHKARAEIRRTRQQGDGMAVAGLVLGYLAMAFWALFVLVTAVAAVSLDGGIDSGSVDVGVETGQHADQAEAPAPQDGESGG